MAAVRSPTVPAPRTRAVEPGVGVALLTAWMATDRGSRSAAASNEISSGSLYGVNTPGSISLEGAGILETYLKHQLAGWFILSWRVPWK